MLEMTNEPIEHHASIGTKDGLNEFSCCEESERALVESWVSSDPLLNAESAATTEHLRQVYKRIAGHLTDHRDDSRTQVIVEGGDTRVVLLHDMEGGIGVLARYAPGIRLTIARR